MRMSLASGEYRIMLAFAVVKGVSEPHTSESGVISCQSGSQSSAGSLHWAPSISYPWSTQLLWAPGWGKFRLPSANMPAAFELNVGYIDSLFQGFSGVNQNQVLLLLKCIKVGWTVDKKSILFKSLAYADNLSILNIYIICLITSVIFLLIIMHLLIFWILIILKIFIIIFFSLV